ncbi:MAG: subclass B3 metallo-beta-lactamase [Lysobacter sp.]
MPLFRSLVVACAMLVTSPSFAAEPLLPQATGYQTRDAWRQPVAPFRIADHTWYVGTQGLSALLVVTPDGAVLIDGGVAQAGNMLLTNIAATGTPAEAVKLILHSHAHGDHAGPLAVIKRATKASLVSNAESAALLARGGSDDIHYADQILYPPVQADRLVQDGERVELGGIEFTVHFTPAHTPGSMSWTWTDTRDGRPLRIAYADSLSAPDYTLLDNPRYPRIVEAYRHGFATVRALPCDLLIAPHPDSVGWTPAVSDNPHPRPTSCRDYADRAQQAFEQLLDKQQLAAP